MTFNEYITAFLTKEKAKELKNDLSLVESVEKVVHIINSHNEQEKGITPAVVGMIASNTEYITRILK